MTYLPYDKLIVRFCGCCCS